MLITVAVRGLTCLETSYIQTTIVQPWDTRWTITLTTTAQNGSLTIPDMAPYHVLSPLRIFQQGFIHPFCYKMSWLLYSGSELFLHYGYDPNNCPAWYREAVNQYLREHPDIDLWNVIDPNRLVSHDTNINDGCILQWGREMSDRKIGIIFQILNSIVKFWDSNMQMEEFNTLF